MDLMLSKKTLKKLDNDLNIIFKRIGYGIQFRLLDIPKIFQEARELFAKGCNLETAMQCGIEKYRVN